MTERGILRNQTLDHHGGEDKEAARGGAMLVPLLIFSLFLFLPCVLPGLSVAPVMRRRRHAGGFPWIFESERRLRAMCPV